MPDEESIGKRNVRFHFRTNEEEAALIRERMARLGVTSLART